MINMKSICLATIVLFSVTLVPGTMHGQTPQKKSARTIRLFNGKDLNGWYTFLKGRGKDNDPLKVFTVKDGMLHITGEEWGCITTKKEYENYKLTVEFKWAGPAHAPRADRARDCGVLIHSKGEDGAYDGTWMNSIECQIIEGGTGDFIVVGNHSPEFSITATAADEKQGSSYLFKPDGKPATIQSGRINWYGRDPDWKDEIGFRGAQDVEKPVGEWNTMEIIARGDEILIHLNGVLVNHATDVHPRKGKIQIQSEAAEIVFRKIELTPFGH